jgi:hypothetical protein
MEKQRQLFEFYKQLKESMTAMQDIEPKTALPGQDPSAVPKKCPTSSSRGELRISWKKKENLFAEKISQEIKGKQICKRHPTPIISGGPSK